MVTAKELGARLRAARKAAGYTQESAAKALDINQTTVSRSEVGNGEITVAQLQRLAELYGRTVADLTAEASAHDSGTHAAVEATDPDDVDPDAVTDRMPAPVDAKQSAPGAA
jgi:transcriptional regulator with XRE-family HTH domain